MTRCDLQNPTVIFTVFSVVVISVTVPIIVSVVIVIRVISIITILIVFRNLGFRHRFFRFLAGDRSLFQARCVGRKAKLVGCVVVGRVEPAKEAVTKEPLLLIVTLDDANPALAIVVNDVVFGPRFHPIAPVEEGDYRQNLDRCTVNLDEIVAV
jgi:hypothetical protein